MNYASVNPPVVLSFSVLDPSGAGGLQASIETAASLGCHCAPTLTGSCSSGAVQDALVESADPNLVIEQARSVLEEMDVKAFNIGFISSPGIAESIHSILTEWNHIPVVSHPSLCLLSNNHLLRDEIIEAYSNLILPLSNIVNLSLFEAREITKETDSLETTAHALLSNECDIAVITGTGQTRKDFQNSAFNSKGLMKHFPWEQEPANCHGASSTLNTATACYLAHGFIDTQAIEQAQNFTWQAMCASRDMGFGHSTPHRMYWADKNIEIAGNISRPTSH